MCSVREVCRLHSIGVEHVHSEHWTLYTVLEWNMYTVNTWTLYTVCSTNMESNQHTIFIHSILVVQHYSHEACVAQGLLTGIICSVSTVTVKPVWIKVYWHGIPAVQHSDSETCLGQSILTWCGTAQWQWNLSGSKYTDRDCMCVKHW